MEMEEVDQDGIDAIGNWVKDVFREHYSNNLPLGAMRSLAGFDNRYVSGFNCSRHSQVIG